MTITIPIIWSFQWSDHLRSVKMFRSVCCSKTKVDNNGISCLLDNDSLLRRLSIMLRPTLTKLGATTSAKCDNISLIINCPLSWWWWSGQLWKLLLQQVWESVGGKQFWCWCRTQMPPRFTVWSRPQCQRVHALSTPQRHRPLCPDSISFIPPFHISNTNSLIKLSISHCVWGWNKLIREY